MNKTVGFREFEKRDVDFVLRCKNDDELNRLIVGESRHFSKEDAEEWVKGCQGNHDSYRFWAICTLDASRDIVGWVSIADIDMHNKSASTHSIVIGDRNYNDGFAWIESILFLFEYAFETLGINRLYGCSLVGHPISNKIGDIMFMQKEGIMREAIFKNGRFYDLLYNAILRKEYFFHKEQGDYQMKNIIKRLRKLRHE